MLITMRILQGFGSAMSVFTSLRPTTLRVDVLWPVRVKNGAACSFFTSVPARASPRPGKAVDCGKGGPYRSTPMTVTGPAGAGRGTAIDALEDLGYEAIDNLPLGLLPRLLEGPPHARPLALGIDPRNRDFATETLLGVIGGLVARMDVDAEVLYLDCSPPVLLRRFSETRRRHPLGDGVDLRLALHGAWAGHQDGGAVAADLERLCDGQRRQGVVAGDHDRADARLAAIGDRGARGAPTGPPTASPRAPG